MPDTPAGVGSLSDDHTELRAAWSDPPASELPCNDSVERKAVRFGSLEPVHVIMAKQGTLPLTVVLVLVACVLACGQAFSLQFCALGLVTFLITAQILSPLDLGSRESVHTWKVVPRIMLEWSCVVAVLVFLATS